MYPMLSTYNMTAPHILLCYANDVTVGVFQPFMILMIFLVFLFASYNVGKSRNGSGDFPASLVLASFVSLITSILFRLLSCGNYVLTSDATIALAFVVFIISLFLLFGSKD